LTRIRIIHNSHWKTNGRKPIANMTHGSSPKAGDYENFRNFPRQIGQSKRFFPHFCYRSKLSSLRTIHEITFLVGNLQGKFPWSVPNSASKQLVSTRLRGIRKFVGSNWLTQWRWMVNTFTLHICNVYAVFFKDSFLALEGFQNRTKSVTY